MKSSPETGQYIVLEGGDNVGKTTQAKILADALGAVQVREPGGTGIGEEIRSLLLDPAIEKAPATEVLLHAAQRAELADKVVQPALASGKHVVSDRSWISSAAYQGAQGADFEDIYRINSFALGSLVKPSLLIVLDVDNETIGARDANSADYYERLDAAFHQNVREKFLDLSQRMGGITLDAAGSIEEVGARIRETVANRLNV